MFGVGCFEEERAIVVVADRWLLVPEYITSEVPDSNGTEPDISA